MLTVCNLSKTFDDEPVISDVSFELAEGESLALWGSSGCGKSTLLALLGLILTPTSGTVYLDDTDCSTLNEKHLAALRRTRFGFIFQHTQLVSSLRAMDNVVLPINLLETRERHELTQRLGAPEKRARELLVDLGLEHRLFHFPHQLSVGQKRRVALARAFISDAPIILADEPTNDLDAASAETVANLLLKASREDRKALIIATHDSALAGRADRRLDLCLPCSS